jgi:hypothetical protein
MSKSARRVRAGGEGGTLRARQQHGDTPMQFLINVIDENTGTATNDEMAAIDIFNDRLHVEGHWVFAAGLAAPARAITIDNRRGKGMRVDGPFIETKEYVAGLWIIEAADLDEARELAAEGSNACNRKVELRPVL